MAHTDSKDSKHVIVTPPKDVFIRKDLTELFENEDSELQASLFLRAFTKIQHRDPSDFRSFYRIGGIHGLPYEAYDGIISDTGKSDVWGGYCQHGTVLFPTWHRAYLLLIEQAIREEALEIVKEEYPDAADWKKAAHELRFPYWDWALLIATGGGIPRIITDLEVKVVTVTTPEKKYETIENPLAEFVLPLDLGVVSGHGNPRRKPFRPVGGYTWTPKGYPTIRHPKPDYTPDNEGLLRTVVTSIPNLRSSLYQVFQNDNYVEISNHSDARAQGNSLEGVHDEIHVDVGGDGGHMTSPETAALDPIFFLHHANVDRVFALWQACHPDSWVTPGEKYDSGNGTVTLPESQALLDDATDLTPFRRDEKQYWNAKELRDISKLGYTFPELSFKLTPSNLLQHVLRVLAPAVETTKRAILKFTKIPSRRLGGSFVIHTFIGSKLVDGDVKWQTSKHHAGKLSIFARARDALCRNCQTKQPQRGAIDITDAILKQGPWFPTDTTTDAELKERLHLKIIIRQAGKEIPIERSGIPRPELQLWLVGDEKSDTAAAGSDDSGAPEEVRAEALTPHEKQGVIVPRTHKKRTLVKSWQT